MVQTRPQIAVGRFQTARQLDGVLERELGPRADRKMRRVRGVAHQHERHMLGVAGGGSLLRPVHPVAADDTRKADPDGRAAKMRCVGDEPVPVEVRRKQLLAIGDALFLRHLLDARGLPRGLGGLDDEGRQPVLEAIGVCLEPAMLGRHEDEAEGVEDLLRSEPDEAAVALVDVGLEHFGVPGPHLAVDAVGRDHQVGFILFRHRLVVFDDGFEHQLHADFFAARLQDVQQLLAPDADEAMASAAHKLSLEVNVDVVPATELANDGLRRDGVGLAQVAHRRVREHDAPTESVVRPVALDHDDLVARVLQLHQQPEIQAGRATTDADDLHWVFLRVCGIRAQRSSSGIGIAACV